MERDRKAGAAKKAAIRKSSVFPSAPAFFEWHLLGMQRNEE